MVKTVQKKNNKSKSRTFLATKNAIFSISINVFNVILRYLSRVIFVMFLDKSFLGINGLFTEIISILSLADLGIMTSMMFSLYKPLRDGDKDTIICTVNFFKKIFLVIAAVVLILGLSFIPVLPFIINLPNDIDNLYAYYVLFVFETATSYLFVYRTILLAADQRDYILTSITAIFNFLKFVVQIIVLIIFKNYFLYLLVGIIVNLLGNLIKNYATYKHYPFLKNKTQNHFSVNEKKELVKNIKSTFIYRFCGFIQNNTDNILISIFVGTIAVGYYSNYSLMVSSIVQLITIVFSSLKASVGNFVAEKKDPKEQMFLFLKLEDVTQTLISLCSFCFLCLFKDFIIFSYGDSYLLDNLTLFAIVLNFYTSNVKQNIWNFREATGIFTQTKNLTLVSAIVNIIISIPLGYYFGIFGILFATSISRFVYAFWREPIILYKNVFKQSPNKYIRSMYFQLFVTFIIGFWLFGLCNSLDLGNSILNIIVKLFIVLFFGGMYYYYDYADSIKYFMKKVKFLRVKKAE